jgi:hypothetical protein
MVDVILRPLGIVLKIEKRTCDPLLLRLRLITFARLAALILFMLLLPIRLVLELVLNLRIVESLALLSNILIPALLLVLKVQEPLEPILLLFTTAVRPRPTGQELCVDLRLGQIVNLHFV